MGKSACPPPPARPRGGGGGPGGGGGSGARALAPGGDEGGPAEDSAHATIHGLFWLLANLAARRPALVVVDDVHWADPPSLRWLGHLARRLDGLPLLVAVPLRAGEPP